MKPKTLDNNICRGACLVKIWVGIFVSMFGVRSVDNLKKKKKSSDYGCTATPGAENTVPWFLKGMVWFDVTLHPTKTSCCHLDATGWVGLNVELRSWPAHIFLDHCIFVWEWAKVPRSCLFFKKTLKKAGSDVRKAR